MADIHDDHGRRELYMFAENADTLAKAMRKASDADTVIADKEATEEERSRAAEGRARAEHAAYAVLRNAPAAIRAITRMQNDAEDVISGAHGRRDTIMDHLFGPDGSAAQRE